MMTRLQRKQFVEGVFNPTEEEIRQACQTIRSQWSAEEEMQRRARPEQLMIDLGRIHQCYWNND